MRAESQHFEWVDVPLHRPVAPRFTDGAFDRPQILTEFPHEPLEGLNLRRLGAHQPAAQRRDGADPQDGAETQDEPTHRRKPGTPFLQRIHRMHLACAERRRG